MPVRAADPFYEQELPVDGIAAVSKSFQQDSELEEYIQENNLSPGARALYLLQNGSNIQQCSVFENLKGLCEECAKADLSKFISELGDIIWKLEPEVQIYAADSFFESLSSFTPQHLQEMLGILKTMIGFRADDVRTKWKPVIVEAIGFYTVEQLETQILDLAFQKGELSENQDSRQLSCDMLGAMALRFDGDRIEKHFLQRAMSLCQDTDYTIRVRMCEQLSVIARAIGLPRTKDILTKELFELLVDEEREVSQSAFTCVVNMLDFLDEAYRREYVLPLVRNSITNPPEESVHMLLDLFGKFIWGLSGELSSDEDFLLFCNFFKAGAQRQDQDPNAASYRELCAFNFPAVVKTIGAKRFSSHLQSTFKAVCEDSSCDTRRRMSAGFHDIVHVLGDKSLSLVKDPFLFLVQDTVLEVQEAIFSHIGEILQQFNRCPHDDKFVFITCVNPIVSYESTVKFKWRKVAALLDNFDHFPDFFPLDVLFDKFIPILFRHLQLGTVALKDKCSELIMSFTRRLQNNQQQVEIFNRLIVEYGKSKQYWHRQTFAVACLHCCNHFSRKFFREKMMETMLDLAKDPISNVRRSLCAILPHVKKVLRPPAPVEMLSNFNDKLSRLILDDDREVGDAAREASALIEEWEHEAQKRPCDDETRLDLQREEEENALMEAAQEQEKQQRRKALRELIAEGEKNLPPGTATSSQPVAGRGRGQPALKKGTLTSGRVGVGAPSGPSKPVHGSLSGSTAPSRSTGRGDKPPPSKFPPAATERETRKGSAGSREDGRPRKNSTGSPSTSSLPSVLPTLSSRNNAVTSKKK